MRKGLIIALAAVLVLGLNGIALAWSALDTGTAVVTVPGEWASVESRAAGGAAGCDNDTCAGCPWDLNYGFTGNAGIINVSGTGHTVVNGSGAVGSGGMYTQVYGDAGANEAKAMRVFTNDTVNAYVCQPCCEIDLFTASTSLNVEDGQAYFLDYQVSGRPSNPAVGKCAGGDTTEQYVQTHGTAGYDIDGDGEAFRLTMKATRSEATCMQPGCPLVFQESHTMGLFGENVDFNVPEAYQGMCHEESKAYGFLGCDEEIWVSEHCEIDPANGCIIIPGHYEHLLCPIFSYDP